MSGGMKVCLGQNHLCGCHCAGSEPSKQHPPVCACTCHSPVHNVFRGYQELNTVNQLSMEVARAIAAPPGEPCPLSFLGHTGVHEIRSEGPFLLLLHNIFKLEFQRDREVA